MAIVISESAEVSHCICTALLVCGCPQHASYSIVQGSGHEIRGQNLFSFFNRDHRNLRRYFSEIPVCLLLLQANAF